MHRKRILSLAALALISSGAWAHDDRVPHYLVYEIPTPDLADPQCVPGYATTAWLGVINNRRFAAGTSSCYHDIGQTGAGGGAPQSLYPTDPLCRWNISIAVTADARGESGGWAVRSPETRRSPVRKWCFRRKADSRIPTTVAAGTRTPT